MKNATLADFKQHLIDAGKSTNTVTEYERILRRFLKHVGNERPDRISEELTRFFFAQVKGKTRKCYAVAVSSFFFLALSCVFAFFS